MPKWFRFYLRLRKRLQVSREVVDETVQELQEAAFMAVSQEYAVDIYTGAELASCYDFEMHRAEVKDIQLDPFQLMTVTDVDPLWNLGIISSSQQDEALPLHIVVEMRRQYLRNNSNAAD